MCGGDDGGGGWGGSDYGSGGFTNTNYGGPSSMADSITAQPSVPIMFGTSVPFSADGGNPISSGVSGKNNDSGSFLSSGSDGGGGWGWGGSDYGGSPIDFGSIFSSQSGGGSPNYGDTGGFTNGGDLSSGVSPLVGFGSAGGGGDAFSPGPGVDIPMAYADPTSSKATDDSLNPRNWTGFETSENGNVVNSGSFTQPEATPDYRGSDMSHGRESPTETSGLPAGGPAATPQPSLLGLMENTPNASPNQTQGLFTPPAPTQPAGGAGGKSLLESIGIKSSPLQTLAAAAGLGVNLFKGNQKPEGYDQLASAANDLQSTGSVLRNYMQTGTLPPGMQTSVDAATKAAKARIISNYASRGLSTDPTKNSSLQQELAGLDQNAIITAATLGDKLMSQGLSASGMANSLYQAIMKVNQDQSAATGNALTNFAAALGGGSTNKGLTGSIKFG